MKEKHLYAMAYINCICGILRLAALIYIIYLIWPLIPIYD